MICGARDGAMERALASHQSGPDSNPGVDAICGLSLLLVLSFAPRGFSPGTPVFPSPQKPTFPNSNSVRNWVDEEPLCGCATSKSLLLLLLLFIAILLLSAHQIPKRNLRTRSHKIRLLSISKFFVHCCHSNIDFT